MSKPSNPLGVPRPLPLPGDKDYELGALMRELHEVRDCTSSTAAELQTVKAEQEAQGTRIGNIEGWTRGLPAVKWFLGVFLAMAVAAIFWAHRRAVETEETDRRLERHEQLEGHPGTAKTLQALERDVSTLSEQLRSMREVEGAHQAELERRLDRIEARRR